MENIKMIAKFMGLVYRTETNYTGWYKSTSTEKFAYRIGEDDVLEYNSSWSALMSVIEKIESIGVSVEINGTYNVFHKASFHQTTINYKVYGTVSSTCAYDSNELFNYHSQSSRDKFKTTFEAVVKFIEWYNTQNKL